MKFSPHTYQSQALQWLIERTITNTKPGAALFLDPGLGKTSITLSWIRLLKQLQLTKGTLVIAPLRVVYSVWPAECRKWDQFRSLKCSIVHGTPTQRLAALATPADLYLMNPEGVPWLQKLAANKEMPFDTLVVDESSKFKSWGATRTKALRKLVHGFARRLILTGTPSPNGLMDLFSQIYITDLGESLGKAISKYRERYFYRGGFGGYKYIPIERAERLIYEKIADGCLRMSAEEFLSLPKLVENDVFVDLPSDARTEYKRLEREFFIALEKDQELTPSNAGARYNVCKQFVNGGCYDAEDKTVVHEFHDAKIKAAQEIVGELQGKPVLLAFQFRHDLDRLRKVWPKLPSIDGRTKSDEAAELLDQWNAGWLPLLAVQPQSLSHGVNMQAGPGRDIVWIGLPDSLENYLQLNARLHRQGVTGQVRIHRVLARNTVDEAVLDRIQRKESSQSSLLLALQKYRKRGS